MTALGKRLAALEAGALADCPTCRGWPRVVYEDAAGRRARPDRCPNCGRLVTETLVRVTYAEPEEAGHAAD